MSRTGVRSVPSGRRVAVFGGGMGGLAVAHELAERGFDVTAYERKALGGKCRSFPAPGTGSGGRQDLPAEHGFRFFPGFYQNLPDTMSRIPLSGGGNAAGNLVSGNEEVASTTAPRSSFTGLSVADGKISGATVTGGAGGTSPVDAGFYVLAVPVERAVPLLNDQILAIDPNLKTLAELTTDWMNGVMVYLNQPLKFSKGHVTYPPQPWALTSINQAQFWKRGFADTYGDGRAADCLSIDLSAWDKPGILYGKPAKECTPDQILAEIKAQLRQSLGGTSKLPDSVIHSFFIDPAITGVGTPGVANDEPLLINTPGSWSQRPESATRLPNLFLAADYVRADVNLATMEGANEAGRKAANAVLDASGSSEKPAKLFTLYQRRVLSTHVRALCRLALRSVDDPGLRDKLTPRYEPGCKRILTSGDYYSILNRPNVHVVDRPITQITARGVRTADDRHYPVDTIIWGTGFRSQDFVAPMRVIGLHGKELNAAWKDGAGAYLGMAVSCFPNYFLMYGPNTNLGSGSVVHILESQIAYIVQAARLLADDVTSLDVRADVLDDFDAATQRRLATSVWNQGGCDSWYLDAERRNSNNWPGYMSGYRFRTRRLNPDDYHLER